MRYIIVIIVALVTLCSSVGYGEGFESRYEHIREHIKSNSSGNDLFTDWIALNTTIIEDLEQQLSSQGETIAELKADLALFKQAFIFPLQAEVEKLRKMVEETNSISTADANN